MPLMRTHPIRRFVAVAAALAVTPALTFAIASPAHAATPFIVIGTSDVSDSNLMAAVIEPSFEAAYPQYDLQYVPLGTGDAITSAEAGNGAALIVHAASLENQFVSQGYSLEPYGRAVFWGDYVLAGPTSDPAGVMNGSSHDIVGALQKVAAAGALGNANFVARGKKPGTAVQEHALWGLTSGVSVCSVSTANGGGARPVVNGGSSSCPDPDANSGTTQYPTWYHSTGASQAINVANANTCNYPSANNNCYVFTDRGTFNYQQSIGNDTNLKIVTQNNDPSARGGLEALVNAFHAYGVNPAKFSGSNKTDATAAGLFLNFLTSAAEQQKIGQYLGAQKPFVPAATPTLTAELRGDSASSNGETQIKGNLANAIPGYPALSGVPVHLTKSGSSSPLAVGKSVATATTNYKGNFKLKAKLKPGQVYSVTVGGITKLEFPNLSPQFSDILQPTSTPLGTAAQVALQSLTTAGKGTVGITGRIGPKSKGKKGRLFVYAAHPGKKLKRVDAVKLKSRQSRFDFLTHLGSGRWKVEVVYQNNKKDLIPTASVARTVTLP